MPVPNEYDPQSFKSKGEQAQKGNANDIARIKKALLILQKAYAHDYTIAAEALSIILGKKVADDIIILLKGGVLNPLLSPVITKAAESGLNKVASIIENITGSVLDSAGIYSEKLKKTTNSDIEQDPYKGKTADAAGDEPMTVKEWLKSLSKIDEQTQQPKQQAQQRVKVKRR